MFVLLFLHENYITISTIQSRPTVSASAEHEAVVARGGSCVLHHGCGEAARFTQDPSPL